MDISIFSPKSQALTLTTTCSTPPPLTWLNPSSSLHPIRRQFLLRRPQTPPSRRKCNSLGLLLHTRSPQFLVKASLHSPPNSILIAVVAALATFAAFSLAYLIHFLQNRRKNSSKQVSDSKIRGTRQLGSDAVDDIIENQIVRISSGESESLMMEAGGSNQVSEERTEQETTFVPDCSYLTETSISIGADSFVSPQECPPFMLSDSGGVQPHSFATEMSELQLGKEQKDVESCESSVLENDDHVEVSVPTVSYGVLTESVREQQFACGRASQSVIKSPANLEFVKAISSHASPLNGYSLSSLKRDTEPKGPELSLQEALQTAEHVEGKIPLACYREGPSRKSKARRRCRTFPRSNPRSNEKRNLMQDGGKNMLQFSYPNGKRANDSHDVSEQLHSYNRLIRQGRISDCIDLLEDMERKGLLDMDKVYHARFFNVCKSQKAIKEAFRFFKLVPNPTLSTSNMLMSVCASSKDSEGAFQVLQLVQEAGLKADCKLYTTLITTCAKSGKVDAMFEVFHEMVNAGIEPNVHTYGALIDGCAKAGQVAKAFGAYGIMRSKNVKPDRVVFNALITACGQSGAVDRAFDVLAEMNAEVHPVDPDHITIGALMNACANAGQVDRAREVYKMIHKYNIKGTPEVYTIAINCCSQTGDWEFACSVYDDMTKKGVVPDEVFLSALIDFAGHAGKVEAAFEILQEAENQGISVGIISYSSLMGACSNAKNWQKALELYEHMKSIKLKPTVSTMNALITALCDGDQLPKTMEVLPDMKSLGLCPNTITYSILLVACERKDDVKVGLMLLSQAKEDGVTPNLVMFKCIIGMCSRRYEKARTLDEHVLSFNSGMPQIENKWTSLALMVYREAIVAGTIPTVEVVSKVLGCLQLPYNADIRERLVENLGVSADTLKRSNLCSLIDGFGEYDPRAFSLLEEAASFGIVPCVSFKESPVVVDARKLEIHTAKVYLLTILKGLRHRLAAGAKLPNVNILLPVEKTQIMSVGGEKTIDIAERTTQAIAALLRRLGLRYQGNGSYGKIRINGLALKRWFQPKLASPFSGKPGELSSLQLGKLITHQQRNIRTGNLSLQ